jgi:hypothetical protein
MPSQLNRVSPYRFPSGAQKPFFAKSLFFAARAGVVKPRQPLCDLNPFDSVFLILRRVGGGTKVVPAPLREFPCSPEGRTFATDLASALHDRCGKPIPALLKGHSAGGTSVPTGNTGACRRTDCVSRTEPSRLGLVGFVLQNHFLPLRAGVVKTTPASMRPCPFRHHLPNLRKHGCRWKRGSRPASRVAPR